MALAPHVLNILLHYFMYRANCFSVTNFSESIATSSNCFLSNNERIYVYTATTSVATVFSFGRALLFYFICVNASRILHNRMFGAVLNTKILFFDSNPVGTLTPFDCVQYCHVMLVYAAMAASLLIIV